MWLSQNSCNVKHLPGACRNFGAFEKKISPFSVEFHKSESDFGDKNQLVNSENLITTKHESNRGEIEDPVFKPGPNKNIDWTRFELTGNKPNVSQYSSKRHSLDEWRKRNEELLDASVLQHAKYVNFNGKSCISTAHGNTNLREIQNTKSIKDRAKDVYRWKVEFEQSCKAIGEEICKLENERIRVQKACESLVITELITNECLKLRSNRRTAELVNDFTDQELSKEKSLEKRVKDSFKDALKQIEEQLKDNRLAKQTLEYGWTDKVVAFDSETVNLGLNTKSNRIMFRPGLVKLTDHCSTPELYEYSCRKTLQDVEATRQRSMDLRAAINAAIQDGAASLRHQADCTDMALVTTIRMTKEACHKSQQSLRETLESIADMERMIENLHSTVRKMDAAMKLAQTRLETRNLWRPHLENVRDAAQIGLLMEVNTIHDTVTSLREQLAAVNNTRKQLMNQRADLERDVANKLHTISIDKGRCEIVRSHFPGTKEICGYVR